MLTRSINRPVFVLFELLYDGFNEFPGRKGKISAFYGKNATLGLSEMITHVF